MRRFSLLSKIFSVRGLAVLFSVAVLLPKMIPYPELDRFLQREYSTRYYDCNGFLLQVTPVDENGTRREWRDLREIPRAAQKIVLKAEDRRFFLHGGVDFFSVASAAFQNLSARRTVRGASTISMQLAHLVSGSEKNRSISGKIKDLINAFRIESKLSKAQILELYLNNVPFGSGVEGFPSAARSFFGTELTGLSREQLACLSVIPRRPTLYNPIQNPEKNAEAASRVLGGGSTDLWKLRGGSRASPTLVESSPTADTEPVEVAILKSAQSAFSYKYPYFMPHYIRYVQSGASRASATRRSLKSQRAEREVSRGLSKGHSDVYLTVDLRLYEWAQGFMEEAFRNTADSRIENAALLVIDNATGNVLCWLSRGEFDGVLHKMQPGSSMKPMLYALALDASAGEVLTRASARSFERPSRTTEASPFRPNMVLPDVPVEFGGENLYIPTNFNNRYNGPVRFRVALASSLNVPAVKILDKIGVEKYKDFLIGAGFESLRDERNSDPGLALALGGAEVTLEELVRSFSIFPNDGFLVDGSGGSTRLTNRRIIESDTARLITSILSDKASRALGFGYSQTFETKIPAIFKTGTANQYQNITALGATKSYTVGVWMGNFSGATVVGKTGSSLPANIARLILEAIDPNAMEFSEPENYEKIKICSLSAMGAGENCPATVYEYAKKGEPVEKCTWHRGEASGVTTVYPAEYESWLLSSSKVGTVAYGNLPLEIKTPQNGAVFYYDIQNAEMQAIPVEIVGGSELTARIIYDGATVFEKSRPFTLSLPIERGTHTIEVVCGGERKISTFTTR